MEGVIVKATWYHKVYIGMWLGVELTMLHQRDDTKALMQDSVIKRDLHATDDKR